MLTNPFTTIDGVFVAASQVPDPAMSEIAANTVNRTTRENRSNRIYTGKNDLIFGGIDSGTISGGNDTLKGGSGDDLFIGGLGNDNHDGGDGEDTVSYGLLSQFLIGKKDINDVVQSLLTIIQPELPVASPIDERNDHIFAIDTQFAAAA